MGRTESSGKKSLCKIPASARYLLTKVHITEIALRGATFSKCILCSTILQLIKIAKKWCSNFLCKIICTPPCSNKGKYGNYGIFPWSHGWFLKGYQLPQGLFVKETKTIYGKLLKMSKVNWLILAFSTNFCISKLTCLVTLLSQKL